MKDNCLDIGTIQAFMDGELSHPQSARVSDHIAICDGCTLMLAEAEDESAIVFSALEREFNSLVPTQRLWNKINDSIEIERGNRPFWEKALAFVRVSLTNQSLMSAAGLLIVFGFFAAAWMSRIQVQNVTVADGTAVSPAAPTAGRPEAPATSVTHPAASVDDRDMVRPLNAERASYRPETRRLNVVPAAATPTSASTSAYLPGEESFVKTIASLAKTVDEQKNSDVMRPSERVAYERDMAVVNDAISKMRRVLKRTPKNEAARQVLYSSYRNKIELLNSVSQKQELVSSLD
ncbi:MAG: zf-HC2 domain-containing protein [Pyrinomonadaceae bacterium]